MPSMIFPISLSLLAEEGIFSSVTLNSDLWPSPTNLTLVVKMNRRAKCLSERSFSSDVIVGTHTQPTECSILPLKWSVLSGILTCHIWLLPICFSLVWLTWLSLWIVVTHGIKVAAIFETAVFVWNAAKCVRSVALTYLQEPPSLWNASIFVDFSFLYHIFIGFYFYFAKTSL